MGRYPVPKHRVTTFYQVGLNSDTEPNSDILANYINDKGDKLVIIVGPPSAFQNEESDEVLITRIENSIFAVVNGRLIALEAMRDFDPNAALKLGNNSSIAKARMGAIGRALKAAYEYMGYRQDSVDWEARDKVHQQVELEKRQQLEEYKRSKTIGEFLSETDDGGGKPEDEDQ